MRMRPSKPLGWRMSPGRETDASVGKSSASASLTLRAGGQEPALLPFAWQRRRAEGVAQLSPGAMRLSVSHSAMRSRVPWIKPRT